MNNTIRYSLKALEYSKSITFWGPALVLIFSLLAFIGVIFDITIFKSVIKGFGIVKANLVICFILLSTYLLLEYKQIKSRLLLVLLLIPLLIAVLTLLQDILGISFGIDTLIIHDTSDYVSRIPGRMSYASSINVILLTLAIFFRYIFTKFSDIFLIYIFSVTLFVLFTYVYNFDFLVRVQYFSTMSLVATTLFLISSISILNINIQNSIFNILVRNDLGGSTARTLLALPIAFPALIILLDIMIYFSSGNIDLTLSLNILASSLFLVCLGLAIAYRLSKNDLERVLQLEKVQIQKTELEKLNQSMKEEVKKRLDTERLLENELSRVIKFEEFRKKIIDLISHQFRTPLTKVISAANIIQSVAQQELKGIPLVDKSIRAANDGINELNYLLRSTETIISLDSTVDQSQISAFNLQEIYLSILEKFESEFRNRTVRFNFQNTNNLVVSRKDVINLVLFHLIDNALKYSSHDVIINIICNYQNFEISVSDSGKGIKEEDLPYIYDLLWRADDKVSMGKYHSLGIGLAVVKYCVDFMNGSIKCESEYEKYTKFTVIFPNLIKAYTN